MQGNFGLSLYTLHLRFWPLDFATGCTFVISIFFIFFCLFWSLNLKIKFILISKFRFCQYFNDVTKVIRIGLRIYRYNGSNNGDELIDSKTT